MFFLCVGGARNGSDQQGSHATVRKVRFYQRQEITPLLPQRGRCFQTEALAASQPLAATNSTLSRLDLTRSTRRLNYSSSCDL